MTNKNSVNQLLEMLKTIGTLKISHHYKNEGGKWLCYITICIITLGCLEILLNQKQKVKTNHINGDRKFAAPCLCPPKMTIHFLLPRAEAVAGLSNCADLSEVPV